MPIEFPWERRKREAETRASEARRFAPKLTRSQQAWADRYKGQAARSALTRSQRAQAARYGMQAYGDTYRRARTRRRREREQEERGGLPYPGQNLRYSVMYPGGIEPTLPRAALSDPMRAWSQRYTAQARQLGYEPQRYIPQPIMGSAPGQGPNFWEATLQYSPDYRGGGIEYYPYTQATQRGGLTETMRSQILPLISPYTPYTPSGSGYSGYGYGGYGRRYGGGSRPYGGGGGSQGATGYRPRDIGGDWYQAMINWRI